MKKIIIIILSLFIITSCNKKEETQSFIDLYTTHNAIELRPGTIFTNIKSMLGDCNNVRTEQSNYIDGEAIIYEYDNFEVETYFDNNIEKIYSIRFTNEEKLTNEDIRIGDTKDKMTSIYGETYTKVNNTYIYTILNTSLSFTLENDIIIDIIYTKVE